MKTTDGHGLLALVIVVAAIVAAGIGMLAMSRRHGVVAAAAGTSLPGTDHTGG